MSIQRRAPRKIACKSISFSPAFCEWGSTGEFSENLISDHLFIKEFTLCLFNLISYGKLLFFFFFPCLRMLFKYIHFFTPEHSFIIILKCSYGLISIMRKNTCHSIIISHLKSNDLGCVPKCSSTIYCLKSAAKLWNVLTLDHLLML